MNIPSHGYLAISTSNSDSPLWIKVGSNTILYFGYYTLHLKSFILQDSPKKPTILFMLRNPQKFKQMNHIEALKRNGDVWIEVQQVIMSPIELTKIDDSYTSPLGAWNKATSFLKHFVEQEVCELYDSPNRMSTCNSTSTPMKRSFLLVIFWRNLKNKKKKNCKKHHLGHLGSHSNSIHPSWKFSLTA